MSVYAKVGPPICVRAFRISPGWLPKRKLSKSSISFTEAIKELSRKGDLQPHLTLTRFKPVTLKWETLAIDSLPSDRLQDSWHLVDLSLAAVALKIICTATEILLLLPPSQNNYQLQHRY